MSVIWDTLGEVLIDSITETSNILMIRATSVSNIIDDILAKQELRLDKVNITAFYARTQAQLVLLQDYEFPLREYRYT